MSAHSRLFLTGMLLFATVRCSGGDDATIRLVHANAFGSVFFPEEVDVYLDDDDEPWITNLAFGDVTEPLEIDAGKHELVVLRAGTNRDDVEEPHVDTVNVEEGDRRVMAYVSRTSNDENGTTSLSLLEDLGGFAKAEGPQVRFFGAIGPDLLVIADVQQTALAFDVGRDGADVQVAPNQSSAEVGVAAGVENELVLSAQGLAELGGFVMPALADGAQYHAVVLGSLLPLDARTEGLRLLLIPPKGEVLSGAREAAVYFLNANFDGVPVQVTVDGAVVANDIAYKQLVGPLRRRSGAIRVAGIGQGLDAGNFSEVAGETDQLIVLSGAAVPQFADQAALTLIKPEPSRFVAPLTSLIRAAHAADSGPLSFALEHAGNTETPLGTNIAFAESTPAPGVRSSLYGNFAVRRQNSISNLAELDGDFDSSNVFDGIGFTGFIVAVGSGRAQAQRPVELVALVASSSFWNVAKEDQQ